MTKALIVKKDAGIRSGAETGITLPALFRPDAATAKRVLEFFTANIRNSNTRKAYAKAAGDFAIWCEARGLRPRLACRRPDRAHQPRERGSWAEACSKEGKTPVLSAEEARALLDAIDTSKLVGLQDRALVALLVYTFARVGAAVKMRVEDIYTQVRRTWVRLYEKGGKHHEMPCHHKLETFLEEYIASAGIADDQKA